MIHPYPKIYSSIPVLFSQGVMRLAAARMQIDQLKAKAPREFNRRVKQKAAEKIDTSAYAPVIYKTREQFEVECA
jgi:hypothetical protein